VEEEAGRGKDLTGGNRGNRGGTESRSHRRKRRSWRTATSRPATILLRSTKWFSMVLYGAPFVFFVCFCVIACCVSRSASLTTEREQRGNGKQKSQKETKETKVLADGHQSPGYHCDRLLRFFWTGLAGEE
jgi:hypothetical protein